MAMFRVSQVLVLTLMQPWSDVLAAQGAALEDGKYVTVREGHLWYNGERLRLWGVNFCGNVKRAGKDLELAFDRIVDAGFNAVRLNLFDSATFLSVPNRTNTHTVPETIKGSGSPMDRLDHAVHLARQRGMFFWFSFDRGRARYLPVDYDVLPDDGTREEWNDAISKVTGRLLCYVDTRAEKVHHEFARSILEHVNPYTGQRYADEETIALYEIFNENLFVRWLIFGGWQKLPSHCQQGVTRRWNEWLTQRYQTDEELRKAWGRLRQAESLAERTVAYEPLHHDVETIEKPGFVGQIISKDKTVGTYPYARGEDVVRFACDLYRGYNQRFVASVRSLGKPGKGISVVPITPTGCFERNLRIGAGGGVRRQTAGGAQARVRDDHGAVAERDVIPEARLRTHAVRLREALWQLCRDG